MWKKFLVSALLTAIISFFSSVFIYAQEPAKEKPITKEEPSWGVAPLPIIASSPETSLMLGALGVFYYNQNPSDKEQKQDQATVLGYYTVKKQYEFSINGNKYLSGNKYNVLFNISYKKFPSEYYGIGNESKKKDRELYTPIYLPFEFSFMTAFSKNIYFGPTYEFQPYKIIKKEDNRALDTERIRGSGKSKASALGLRFQYNSRDNENYTRKGQFLDVDLRNYNKAIGSDYDFNKVFIDYRFFHQIIKNHILAFQCVYTSTSGNIPFYYLPSVGGGSILRGFIRGRYVDNDLIVGQLEYRYPIYWRFSGTAFVGTGEVAPKISSFSGNTHSAFGIGLRFLNDADQDIHIRLDVAFTSDKDINYYFNILEAF